MKITSAEVQELLKLLAAAPRRITTLSRGLKDARLYAKADEAAWSFNDILAHLRACADVWGKGIRETDRFVFRGLKFQI